MSVIAIVSIIVVLGAALGLFLTHRLVGFRHDGPWAVAEARGTDAPLVSASEIHAVSGQIGRLQAEVAHVREQLSEREVRDEELQKQVRQVRLDALRFKTLIEDRLGNQTKAWEQVERDLERLGHQVDGLAYTDQIEHELHELSR